MMFKEDSHRGGKNVLAIPDNITDLLGLQAGSLERAFQEGQVFQNHHCPCRLSLDVKHIELYRSDGYTDKFIKILKFKGTFYTKMLSLDNTLQRFLDHKRQIFISSEYEPEKMDTAQIEGCFSSTPATRLTGTGRRRPQLSQEDAEEKIIDIDELPPRTSGGVSAGCRSPSCWLW